ncbi:MAG: DNA/RNA nuclease SfsA [Candidatus Hodarchaeota archaeon]
MIIARGVIESTFLERPNRFLTVVKFKDGTVVESFLPDPGRLKELLIPGVKVWVSRASKKERKTKFDTVAVEYQGTIVCIDTRVPNKFVGELLLGDFIFKTKFEKIKPEFTYKNSRLDFYAEANGKKYLMEVKSVTLVEDGVAKFPDAPTTRGTKHVNELMQSLDEGYVAILIFVIQRDDAMLFGPKEDTDPDFAAALKRAKEEGVIIKVFKNKIHVDKEKNLLIEPLQMVGLNF